MVCVEVTSEMALAGITFATLMTFMCLFVTMSFQVSSEVGFPFELNPTHNTLKLPHIRMDLGMCAETSLGEELFPTYVTFTSHIITQACRSLDISFDDLFWKTVDNLF